MKQAEQREGLIEIARGDVAVGRDEPSSQRVAVALGPSTHCVEVDAGEVLGPRGDTRPGAARTAGSILARRSRPLRPLRASCP